MFQKVHSPNETFVSGKKLKFLTGNNTIDTRTTPIINFDSYNKHTESLVDYF